MNKNFFSLYKKYMYFISYAGQSLYLLQAYKIVQMQSSQDVSLVGFTISFIAVTSVAFYGYLLKDKLLTSTYIFGSIAAFVCLVCIIAYL